MVLRAATWPAGIFPSTGMFGFNSSTRSGGASIGNSEQIVAANPSWRARFSGPAVTQESVLSWRAFVAGMNGRAGTVLVPRWEEYGVRDMNGKVLSQVEAASYDHGGLNFDLSGFGQEEPVHATLAANAALNATQISVNVLDGEGPRPGQFFGIGDRLHMAIQAWQVEPGDPLQIQFTPWLRAPALAGARVILDRPVCLMRFASDQTGDLDLDMGRWGSGELEMVEAL